MKSAVRDKTSPGAERGQHSASPKDGPGTPHNVVACTLPRGNGVGKSRGESSLPEPILQAVFDGLDDAVFIVDANERIVAANAPAAAFLADSAGTNTWDDILALAGTDSEALDRAWHGLSRHGETRIDCTLHRQIGDEIVAAEVLLRSLPGMNGALRMVTLRDVSKQRRRENLLRKLASVDDLTQVANRRHFMELLDQETGRARRYGQPVALLMVDADHFKGINDRHGHDMGDRALQLLARVAKKACRAADLVGRVGGEEFAILLPETRIEKALRVAERLRMTVADTALDVGGRRIHFTVSIGVAAACGAECHGLELLQRADAALYAAKNQGRNRVVADPQALEQDASNCIRSKLRPAANSR